MTTNTVDIDICVDCLQILANGVETDEHAQVATDMYKIWGDALITPNCDEECEGHFSNKACEGCGSDLGGDRHKAVVFLNTDKQGRRR